MPMFPMSILKQVDPILRHLCNDLQAVELELNQVAHYREDPKIVDAEERRAKLSSLQNERSQLMNRRDQQARMVEQRLIQQQQQGR